MRVYKRLSAAVAAAKGKPFVYVGGPKGKRVYIVGPDELHEVVLLTPSPSGGMAYAGHICFGHLNRLGNGNHATERPGYVGDIDAYPESTSFSKKRKVKQP